MQRSQASGSKKRVHIGSKGTTKLGKRSVMSWKLASIRRGRKSHGCSMAFRWMPFVSFCVSVLLICNVCLSLGPVEYCLYSQLIYLVRFHTLVAATADTMELLQKFEQDPRDEPTKNTKNTKHCGDSSVFVGSKSSFANGLYRCCTHQSTYQKLAQVQALAGLYGMIAAWLTTIIAYPMRSWLAIEGEKIRGAPGCLDL